MIKVFVLLMLLAGSCWGSFSESLEQASYKTDIDLAVADYMKELRTVDYKLLPQSYYNTTLLANYNDKSYLVLASKIASTIACVFWACGAKWGYDQKTNYGNITGTYFAIRSAKELYDAIFKDN